MTTHLKLPVLAILFVAASGCVSHRTVLNDSVPTLHRWQKLDATQPGRELNVQLQTGAIISGSFQGSTADQLSVTTGSNEINVPKRDVLQITAAGADSLNNGTAWGLGLGGLFAWSNAVCCGPGAAAGAFVTWLILPILADWRHQEHEVIYIAPYDGLGRSQ